MATFKLNGIQFTADNTSLLQDGQRTVKFGNTDNGDFADASTDGVVPFVNAVEIDWNAAQVAEQTVNTTGQLLKIINDLYNKVNNISTDVKVSSISLDYTSSTWQADKGETMNVTATVYPTGATNSTIKWTSSNTSVATVSSSSAKTITVTCKGYGSATIKCTAQDGSGVFAKFDVKALEPTTTQASTPTPTPSQTPTDTPTDTTTPAPTPANHYLPYSVMTASAQSSMDNVTSSIALAATQTSTGNHDLQSSSLTITAPSLSCLIIALPMYATSINVHYVKTVERYNSLSQGWDAMSGIKMFANTSNSKNYFVIASKATSGSKYRITFTTSKPSYVTGGGTTQPETTGSTAGTTPSSTTSTSIPQTTILVS